MQTGAAQLHAIAVHVHAQQDWASCGFLEAANLLLCWPALPASAAPTTFPPRGSAAGKVTPELAADLKFGLGSLQPIRRWVYYSMLKPLYDVASWDKLVECLKKAAHEAGGT